jgi:predicted O-methyltransferase YrrM
MKHLADSLLHGDQAAYLEALEPARDALLTRMEAYAREHGEPISDPEVASFLAVTAASRAPRLVVELGTNIGYGAIVLARAAREARVITVERSARHCAIARTFVEEAGLSDRVEVREGTALGALDALGGELVDLFYFDCVKEEYPAYLSRALPLLAPRGVLVADNALWKGLVARKDVPEAERARVEALRAFNRALVSDPRLRGVVLPLGDGVGYAVRVD